MSRCFPFPPPGYEKKARIDDADLLKKEKHREKKHKKEKKDKEKKEGKEKREKDRSDKEGKEKREKDRSDSKHRDKKDRKDKHRDKKEKEKDKDKDDVKNHTSVDKKLAGQSETSNGEKLGQKERVLDKGSSSISNEKIPLQSGENHDRKSILPEGAGDYKFVQELGRRIRDEEGNGSQMMQRSDGCEQRSDKQNQRADNLFDKDTGTLAEGKGKNSDKKIDYRKIDGQGNRGDPRLSGNAAAQNHAGMAQSSMGGMARPVEKIIPSGNPVVQNHVGMTQKRVDRVARPLEKNVDSRLSGDVLNLSGMAQKSIGGMVKPPEKNISSGSAGVQNLVVTSQIRGEGVAKPMEKKVETRMEEKEKSKEKEGDEKRGDKRKGKDREKKSHGKDKEREKDRKKEKGEHKSKNPDKSKDKNKNNLPDPSSVRTSDVSKNGDRNTAAEENLNKRKHSETNGFLHDTDARPNKVPRPTPHLSTENGRKLEPPASINPFTSDKRGPSMNVDNKEHKVNGLIEVQSLPVSSSKTSAITQADRTLQASRKPPHPDSKHPSKVLSIPKMEELSGFDNKEHKVNGLIEAQSLPISSSKTSATTQADRSLQASRKPPHPDSKYLSQILSIPKMEDWSDFDDQEWLFCSKRSSDKTDARSAMVIETPRVWAEALQIESADVCALPYVIPF